MAKTYEDFLDAVADAIAEGETTEAVVLTEESFNGFFTDGNFTEKTEETQNNLGEFSIRVEKGENDYIITKSGETFDI